MRTPLDELFETVEALIGKALRILAGVNIAVGALLVLAGLCWPQTYFALHGLGFIAIGGLFILLGKRKQ